MHLQSTLIKKSHGFEVMLHLWGSVTKKDAVQALKDFAEDDLEYPNNIKIITCALMGHGTSMESEMIEGDW